MQTHFYPFGDYADILEHIAQWKVLDIQTLKTLCNFKTGYHNLLFKLRKLEKEGLVASNIHGSRNKYVYLTEKGVRTSGHFKSCLTSIENLNHDIITARALKEFLKLDYFFDGMIDHEILGLEVNPDAVVNIIKYGEKDKLALEIELNQKTKHRVQLKYMKYAQSHKIDYSLFITNKVSLYKSYTKFLLEMKDHIQDTNIIMLDQQLSRTTINLKDSKVFYIDEELSFGELFRAP